MAEASIDVEKEIEQLNSLQKFKEFIDICVKYHLKKCEKNQLPIRCRNCIFIQNLKRCYAEKILLGCSHTNIQILQNCCRNYPGSFYSLWALINSLVEGFQEKRLINQE